MTTLDRSNQIIAMLAAFTLSLSLAWSQTTATAAAGPAPEGTKTASASSMGMPPMIDSREVDEMKDHFALSEDQQELVQATFDGYAASYRDLGQLNADEMRAMRENARETRDYRAFAEELRQRRQDWHEAGVQLERQFFEDVQTILTRDQMNVWPAYERDYRRRSTLSRGARFSGESVDLFELVEETDLSDEERDSLAEALESYANELDQALIARNELFEQYQAAFRAGPGTVSPERRVEISNRLDDQRRLVRDINQRYIQSMANQLSIESGEQLREGFKRRSFPWIYRETLADEYIADALKLNDLTEDQQQQIQTQQTQYEITMTGLNDRLAELQRTREDAMQTSYSTADRESGERQRQIEEMRRLGQQVGDMHRERQDLIDRVVESVHNLLTLEQQAALPKPTVQRPDQQREMLEEGSGRRGETGIRRPGPGARPGGG